MKGRFLGFFGSWEFHEERFDDRKKKGRLFGHCF